jgi:hypothetical protein
VINNGTILRDGNRAVSMYGNIGVYGTFYRGEHKVFNSTKSKLAREINDKDNKEDIVAKLLIQNLQILFLGDYITSIKNIDKWNLSTIFVELIAQHYGISTQYLDLTDDIGVALFFACTKINSNNELDYLKKEDLDNDFGQYGVIHKINVFGNLEKVSQIGYQPFTRCHRQRGYYIDTYKYGFHNYDLSKEESSVKYCFKRTESFCKKIFDYFDSGKYLFSKKDENIFEKAIDKIKKIKEYNQEDYDIAVSFLNDDDKKIATKQLLSRYGYFFVDVEHEQKENILSLFEKLDMDEFVKEENINPIVFRSYNPK